MTPTQTPQRRGPKPRPAEDILISVCVRLTPAQKRKLMTLGGGPWLREKLRRTAAPQQTCNPI
ncbi:hypothetical protein ABIC90_001427 [Variovorax boronicumulans]